MASARIPGMKVKKQGTKFKIKDKIFNSYTMDTSGLPGICTQSLRAAGPRAEDVHCIY